MHDGMISAGMIVSTAMLVFDFGDVVSPSVYTVVDSHFLWWSICPAKLAPLDHIVIC